MCLARLARRGARSLDSTDSTLIIAELARHRQPALTHFTFYIAAILLDSFTMRRGFYPNVMNKCMSTAIR